MDTKDNKVIEKLLKGKLNIIQKRNGYRFSIDAVLLANFTTVKKQERIVDLGTGSGVIPLILSRLSASREIVGVELDKTVAEMAKESVEINGLGGRISILQGDVTSIRSLLPPESFHLAVTNPPYGKITAGRPNPLPEKAAARHEICGGLNDFLAAAAYLLKYRGRISLIYPVRRLSDVIAGMRAKGLEPKRMRFVHSREGEEARLVLVEGIKGGGVEMTVMKPLCIYNKDGRYTEEVEAMYG